jgi:hypothetical protein
MFSTSWSSDVELDLSGALKEKKVEGAEGFL